jgi:hypothetical protein
VPIPGIKTRARDAGLFSDAPCIFTLSLLGSFEKDSQAGVIGPVATEPMTVRVGTFAPGIRFGVMRPVACFTRAHCPKLEPLFEHDNSKIVARILQV